jgi:hypothetical protein
MYKKGTTKETTNQIDSPSSIVYKSFICFPFLFYNSAQSALSLAQDQNWANHRHFKSRDPLFVKQGQNYSRNNDKTDQSQTL